MKTNLHLSSTHIWISLLYSLLQRRAWLSLFSRASTAGGAYYNNNNNNLNSNLVHMLNLDQDQRDRHKRNNNESNRGALRVLYCRNCFRRSSVCNARPRDLFRWEREKSARRGFKIIKCWSSSVELQLHSLWVAFWLDGVDSGWDARQKLSCVSELKKTIWHSSRGEPNANVYFLFANCQRAHCWHAAI